MKNRRNAWLAAFLAGVLILLSAAVAGASMVIELAEYRPPSADIRGPGEEEDPAIQTEKQGNPAGTEETATPVPAAEPTPKPVDYSHLWIGEWILEDEPETLLIISPGAEGKLHIEAYFYRMVGIEAEIDMNDDDALRFVDNDNSFVGGLHREREGEIRLAVYGGHDMGSNGAFKDFFLTQDFVFTKDGKRRREEAGEKLRRLTRDGCTTVSRQDEQYRKSDVYTFFNDGRISSWEHFEYDESGYRSIRRSGDNTEVNLYDPSGKLLKNAKYESGVVRSIDIYTFDNEGKKTGKHEKRYEDRELNHAYEYYEYDTTGRLISTRRITEKGVTGTTEKYDYSEDGSRVEKTHNITGEPGMEVWYDSQNRETRRILYVNGEVYSRYDREYESAGNGRNIIRISTWTDGQTNHEIRESELSSDGKIFIQRERNPEYNSETVRKDYRNSKKRTVYTYERNEYRGGNEPLITLEDAEYEYDSSGTRQIANRKYRYDKMATEKIRHSERHALTLYEGDKGTRLGISPLPQQQQGNGENHSLSLDDIQYAIRDMSRTDIISIFHARQVSECIYDSPDRIELCGYTGSLRFVFEGRNTDRLQSVCWVCEDSYEAAARMAEALKNEGAEWYSHSGWEKPNALGLYEESGYIPDGRLTLTAGSQGDQPLVWFCCSYSWRVAEEGNWLPWEYDEAGYDYNPDEILNPKQSYGPTVTKTPAEETVIEPAPKSGTEAEPETKPEDKPETEAETAPEPESESELLTEPGPEPEPEPEPEQIIMTDKGTGVWTGYWMTGGEDQGELVITAGEDGLMKMRVFFLRTFDLEADLKRLDESRCTFETTYGHYSGTLTREENGGLRFAVTGGMTMEDDEDEFHYFFKDHEYIFHEADYADLWYEAPAEGTEDDADWAGQWTAQNGNLSSRIIIARGVKGDYVLQLSFSTGYAIAGPLEKTDSRTMDFVTDDFSAMLTLNRKKHAILMSEIGSLSDDVYAWLDDTGAVIVYNDAGKPAAAPASDSRNGKNQTNLPARTESPAMPDARLIPVSGKPEYLEIPVSQVNATSFIVGKDPEAYTPFRMVDRDESTAFQFSTKESSPGSAYLYFEFDSAASPEELWIKNGIWKKEKGKDPYARNCRMKEITIDFRYSGGDGYQDATAATLKDDKRRTDWTVVPLGQRKNVTGVRIRVDSIYKGTKFKNDVCVTEIMFVKKADSE